jgi:hypothetical protein
LDIDHERRVKHRVCVAIGIIHKRREMLSAPLVAVDAVHSTANRVTQ